MYRNILKYTFAFAAAVLAAAACNTTGCLDNQSALPLAGLFSSATGKPITLNNIEIRGVGAPGDSLLVAKGTSVSEIYLPMRPTMQQTAWRIIYAQEGLEGIEDVVTFDYDSEPYFASEECGAMYNYRITRCSTTYNLIDSVVVADSLITNVDRLRIKIYFHTSEEPEDPEEPENPDTPDTPDTPANPDTPDE